jgi:hypothetical protein
VAFCSPFDVWLLSERPPLEIALDVNQIFIMSLRFTVVRPNRAKPENILASGTARQQITLSDERMLSNGVKPYRALWQTVPSKQKCGYRCDLSRRRSFRGKSKHAANRTDNHQFFVPADVTNLNLAMNGGAINFGVFPARNR